MPRILEGKQFSETNGHMSSSSLLDALYQQKRIYHQPIVSSIYRAQLDCLQPYADIWPRTTVLDKRFEQLVLFAKIIAQYDQSFLSGLKKSLERFAKSPLLFSQHGLATNNLLQGDMLSDDFTVPFDRIVATSVFEHIADLSILTKCLPALLNNRGSLTILSPHKHCMKWLFGNTASVIVLMTLREWCHQTLRIAKAFFSVLGKVV